MKVELNRTSRPGFDFKDLSVGAFFVFKDGGPNSFLFLKTGSLLAKNMRYPDEEMKCKLTDKVFYVKITEIKGDIL